MSITSDVGHQAMTEEVVTGIRKMEGMLERMGDLPVQKLKDDMKELQVRVYSPFLLLFVGVGELTSYFRSVKRASRVFSWL